MESTWEMNWAGIEALKPVSMMSARLLIVPLLHPANLFCNMDHLLGGVHCKADFAVIVSGVCTDAVYPPRDHRRIAHCCFYN